MNEKEIKIINRLEEIIHNTVSNEFLVQLLELGADYLNLETISNYAKLNNLSYNGVKNAGLLLT